MQLRSKTSAGDECRGPDFGKLTQGCTVLASSGQEVSPEMCLEQAVPGEVIVVVDCPDISYLAALASAADDVEALADDSGHRRVKVFCHLTPEGVVKEPRYQEWMARFPRWLQIMAGDSFDADKDAPSLSGSYKLQVHTIAQ
jgi:hypothetical protein